jgi:uncharacterized protein (TIGR02246 family)
LDGRIEIAEVITSGPRFALFSGIEQTETGPVEVFVQVFDGSDPFESAQVSNRFQEARFLQHPNLLKIGRIGRDDTAGVVYVCSPRPDSTLGQFVEKRRLKPREAREFASQLISALTYLHSENMVFCNLRASSVWRAGTAWLLADFSQMRLASSVDKKELRQALTIQTDLPPEAYEGIVTPAWDSWGLGMILRTAMTPEPPPSPDPQIQRARQLRDVELPPPFDSITRDCLEADPEVRIQLEEIKARLAGGGLPSLPNAGIPDIESSSPGDETDPNYTPSFREPELPRSPARVWGLVALAVAALVGILWAGGALGRLTAPSEAAAPRPVSAPPSEADRTVAEPGPGSVDRPAPSVKVSQAEIQKVVDRWAAAIRKRDADALAEVYAPIVNVYYDQKKITRDQLRAKKEEGFRSISEVKQYDLKTPQFQKIDDTTAVVTFDREWRFGGKDWSSGSDRVKLTLEFIDAAWRISAERELKSYWARSAKEN